MDRVTTLFVNNLASHIIDEQLKTLFVPYGEILKCRVVRHLQTLESRGFAFVEYSDRDSCMLAMNKLNGTDFFGEKLVVTLARPLDYKNRIGPASRKTFPSVPGVGSPMVRGRGTRDKLMPSYPPYYSYPSAFPPPPSFRFHPYSRPYSYDHPVGYEYPYYPPGHYDYGYGGYGSGYESGYGSSYYNYSPDYAKASSATENVGEAAHHASASHSAHEDTRGTKEAASPSSTTSTAYPSSTGAGASGYGYGNWDPQYWNYSQYHPTHTTGVYGSSQHYGSYQGNHPNSSPSHSAGTPSPNASTVTSTSAAVSNTGPVITSSTYGQNTAQTHYSEATSASPVTPSSANNITPALQRPVEPVAEQSRNDAPVQSSIQVAPVQRPNSPLAAVSEQQLTSPDTNDVNITKQSAKRKADAIATTSIPSPLSSSSQSASSSVQVPAPNNNSMIGRKPPPPPPRRTFTNLPPPPSSPAPNATTNNYNNS